MKNTFFLLENFFIRFQHATFNHQFLDKYNSSTSSNPFPTANMGYLKPYNYYA